MLENYIKKPTALVIEDFLFVSYLYFTYGKKKEETKTTQNENKMEEE